jgi:hypothetical protein
MLLRYNAQLMAIAAQYPNLQPQNNVPEERKLDISNDFLGRLENKHHCYEFSATKYMAELSARSNGLGMPTEMENKQMSITGIKRGTCLKAENFQPQVYGLPFATDIDLIINKVRWNVANGEELSDQLGQLCGALKKLMKYHIIYDLPSELQIVQEVGKRLSTKDCIPDILGELSKALREVQPSLILKAGFENPKFKGYASSNSTYSRNNRDNRSRKATAAMDFKKRYPHFFDPNDQRFVPDGFCIFHNTPGLSCTHHKCPRSHVKWTPAELAAAKAKLSQGK